MNRLHQVIENASTIKNSWIPGESAEHRSIVNCGVSTFLRYAKHAQCFYGGNITNLKHSVIPELCVLPYDVCWFEFEVDWKEYPQKVIFAALVANIKDGEDNASKHFYWYFVKRDGWTLVCSGLTRLDVNVFHVEYYCDDENRKIVARAITGAVRWFLSAINCKNVCLAENNPDSKLQKARAKKGKAPLFSYWTLQINSAAHGNVNLGGTHASPRVHLRRGHPRQYEPGKWTWVQPHAVGNRALGMVHKDYSMVQP